MEIVSGFESRVNFFLFLEKIVRRRKFETCVHPSTRRVSFFSPRLSFPKYFSLLHLPNYTEECKQKHVLGFKESVCFHERSQNCEKRLLASLYLSVRAHGTTRLPLCQLFLPFCIWVFFENLSRIYFYKNLTRITGALHEDQCKVLIISRSAILRMRKFSDKSCRQNQNT